MSQSKLPESTDNTIKYFVQATTYAILVKWNATENTMYHDVYTLTDDSELPNAVTRFTREQIEYLQAHNMVPWLNWDVVTFIQAY